jgi:hypothetical protein
LLFIINFFLFVNSLGCFVAPKTEVWHKNYYVAETPLLSAPCLRGSSSNSMQEAISECQRQASPFLFVAIMGCIAFLCFWIATKKEDKTGKIVAFIFLLLFTIILLSKFEC